MLELMKGMNVLKGSVSLSLHAPASPAIPSVSAAAAIQVAFAMTTSET